MVMSSIEKRCCIKKHRQERLEELMTEWDEIIT